MAAQDDDDETGTEAGPNLALLKWIVIGMGVLIVAGVLFLIYTVSTRVAGGGMAAKEGPAPAATLPPGGFGRAEIAVPPGTQVVGAAAGDGLLVLTLRSPGRPDSVLLLDPASGQERGRLVLQPGGE